MDSLLHLQEEKIEYQVFSSKDIDTKTLMEWLFRSTDIFELLSTKMLKYKLNTQITLSQFVRKILKDVDSSLKLPIVVTKEAIYSNMTPEYVGTLLPKEYRKAERENLFRKFEKLDEGRRFWRNFEVVRKQSELRWFELHKLLFADVSDDLGEMKKAKDRFFKYKKNKQIPPEDIIEKILEIFLIERVDLFQKSVSDLQNF